MNTIHVEITGSEGSGKTVVANVIQDALTKSGFQNVTQISDTGEPIAAQEPTTILDLVRDAKPELFATPITISETRWAGDDDEVTNAAIERIETEVEIATGTAVD
jgi:thymidylate kinase